MGVLTPREYFVKHDMAAVLMLTKAKGLGYDEVVNFELEQTKKTVWAANSSK